MSNRLAAAGTLSAAAVLAAAVPAGVASRPPDRTPDWAGPQISAVLAAGLMGGPDATDFQPQAPLTRQALADLGFGLQQLFAPRQVDPPVGDPAPAATTTPAETDPAPAEPPPAAPAAPQVTEPDASATMALLDRDLVGTLGLSSAAGEFKAGAAAAGLRVPWWFGTEVVARLLGLRTNHPAAEDYLELRPRDPTTRAEAAYSAARILGFGWLGNGWQTAAVQSLADSFALRELTDWQRRILQVAVAKVGMPYVWGGTRDGWEAPFGVRARGGYDCSGFVWRVYKLHRYPGEGALASMLRGRTTYEMSGEVPPEQRIAFADLQPADVVFFGARGPASSPARIDHMGIYLGNGWFVHSSDRGVALARLEGRYRTAFAWGRRPLREAGLTE